MLVSRDGKIHEGLDPWLFDGMKNVFCNCVYCKTANWEMPDSRYWDFRDLAIPHCPICGEKESIGASPSWRMTRLPVNESSLKDEDLPVDYTPLSHGISVWDFLGALGYPFWFIYKGIRWWWDP